MSLFNNVSDSTKAAIQEQAPRLLKDAAELYLPDHLRQPLREITSLYEDGFSEDAIRRAGLRALMAAGQYRAVREVFLNTKNPLLGGVTPLRAMEYLTSSPERAMSNLFLVSVEPLDSKALSESDAFNMFCQSVDYAPFTVSGEYQRVGSVLVDSLTGNEAVEMQMTTLDDKAGTLKRWFAQMSARAASSDGTFGVPASYGIKISVTHAFGGGDIPEAAYTDTGYFRVANLALNGARGENALSELQMTFNQIDTFWG